MIGFLGNMNSGKDTCADYLVKEYHYEKKAFASPLKKVCQTLFLLSDSQITDKVQKETIDERWGKSPRQIFQYIGTEILRDQLGNFIPGLGRDIFTKHLKLSIEGNHSGKRIAISDVRFQNEVDLIHEMGGYVIKIIRHDKNHGEGKHASWINSGQIDSKIHSSETELEEITDYDACLINNGTIEDLYLSLEKILKNLDSFR